MMEEKVAVQILAQEQLQATLVLEDQICGENSNYKELHLDILASQYLSK